MSQAARAQRARRKTPREQRPESAQAGRRVGPAEPVRRGQAAGIQSSASYYEGDPSRCGYMTYMTTDTLPSGVSLLYGP